MVRAGICLLALLGSLVSDPATATTVIGKSFAQLSLDAEEVFAATVDQVRSYRRSNGRIWTVVRFGQLRSIVGSGESTERELHFAGGRIGDRREAVGGMPEFNPGQRVVLFVRDAGTASPIVGFHQGCFGLRSSPDGETVHTLDGRPVLAVNGGELRTGDAGASGGMRLEAFARAVETLRRPSAEESPAMAAER